MEVEHFISERTHCLKVLGKSMMSLSLVWLLRPRHERSPGSPRDPTNTSCINIKHSHMLTFMYLRLFTIKKKKMPKLVTTNIEDL